MLGGTVGCSGEVFGQLKTNCQCDGNRISVDCYNGPGLLRLIVPFIGQISLEESQSWKMATSIRIVSWSILFIAESQP